MKEPERRPDALTSNKPASTEHSPDGARSLGTLTPEEFDQEIHHLTSPSSYLRDYAVIGIDQNRLICAWSAGAQDILGWNEQEILGQPAGIFFTPEDVENGEPHRELDSAIREGSIEEERWHIRKDGSRFWGSGILRAMHDNYGGVRAFVKIMRDVTGRRQAEEQLRESEERFRLFVENVTDYALLQVDPDRNISGWNTGAERSFGYSEEEILGKPMNVLFAPEDIAKGEPEKDFEKALAAGRSEYERWLVRKDGTQFWARWVTTPMYDEGGRLHGYAKVLHDETERKQVEDQLRAGVKEKNALVQEVHHRVKNNLQVISSLLSLQAERLRSPQILAVLQDTQTRVAAIAAIHEQLYASQDLSSIEFGPYLRKLVRGLFRIHDAKKERIALKIEAADVTLDVQQAIPLGLITNELVINALKHAFPQNRSGMITVSLTYISREAAVGEPVDEGLVRLTVEDNGVGLAPDVDISQVSSMGFSLVHLLVQQLRGNLEIGRGPGLSAAVAFRRDKLSSTGRNGP